LKYFHHTIFFAAVFCSLLKAQDSHYWTNQYGTQAQLLGGAVVGSAKDLSSTFYNPGVMALTKDAQLALTTDAIQITNINYQNNRFRDLEFNSTKFKPAPGMFALRLPFEPFEEHQIAISYVTRTNFEMDLDGWGSGLGVDSLPGTISNAANEVILRHSTGETWVGITWSHKIGKAVSLGATSYVGLRSQSGRAQVIMQSIDEENLGSAIVLYDDFSYWNARLLFKIGAIVELGSWKIGLTLTTPSLNLFGTGRYGFNEFVISEELPQGNAVLRNNYQEDLQTKFNSPLSLAAGTSYTIFNTVFHFTIEWFNHVPEFKVMEPKPYTGQSSGETYQNNLAYSLSSVINAGLGFEHVLSSSVELYGSFITNFSANDENVISRFILTFWDIYQISAGTVLNVDKLALTFGVTYGFGSGEKRRMFPSADFDSGRLVNDALGTYDIKYNNIKLLFGFSYQF
jgi:hypothetical protein